MKSFPRKQARFGDRSFPSLMPAATASSNVLVNSRNAVRVGDCGVGNWVASEGAPHVLINNRLAHRVGDGQHNGRQIEGSSNVLIGGSSPRPPHLQSALVRIVPKLLAAQGNVLAYVERIDGQDFLPSSAILFHGQRLDAWHAPDRRLYFVPPPRPVTDAVLIRDNEDVDHRYGLEHNVACTRAHVPAVESIVQQMRLLRKAKRLRIEAGGEDIRLRHDYIMKLGHRRFERAMHAVYEKPPHASSAVQVEVLALIGAFITEHSNDLDDQLTTYFSEQDHG